MANVSFTKDKQEEKPLYFRDLVDNDSFVIESNKARGAIYRCVVTNHDIETSTGDCMLGGEYFMMEEVSGRLFSPTESPVRRVSVEVVIDSKKPSIY